MSGWDSCNFYGGLAPRWGSGLWRRWQRKGEKDFSLRWNHRAAESSILESTLPLDFVTWHHNSLCLSALSRGLVWPQSEAQLNLREPSWCMSCCSSACAPSESCGVLAGYPGRQATTEQPLTSAPVQRAATATYLHRGGMVSWKLRFTRFS